MSCFRAKSRIVRIFCLLLPATSGTCQISMPEPPLTWRTAAEIISVQQTNVPRHQVSLRLRLKNADSEGFFIAVNGSPPKLNHICAYLERQEGKRWKKVPSAKGLVLGDRPPDYKLIKAGASMEGTFSFYPAEYELKPQSRVRLAIMLAHNRDGHDWCTEGSKLKIVSPEFRIPVKG